MKNIVFAFILINTATIINVFAQDYIKGFYITKNNDTIHTKIVVQDLFKYHYNVTIIDSLGKEVTMQPTDIKGFYFSTKTRLDYNKTYEQLNHTYDNLILKTGYIYKKKTFSLESEIHSNSIFYPDTIYKYESCRINQEISLFLLVQFGNGGPLHVNKFYSKIDPYDPYYSVIWFISKNQTIIEYNNRKLKDWIAEGISDYSLLNSMVQDNYIKAFPYDFDIVINDYNNWSRTEVFNRPDTSMTIKGILDANQYFKTGKYFAIPCVSGTAFFFPGMISAVIIAHNPKEEQIKIPQTMSNKDNLEYDKAFKHKAYEKKYKSAAHGALAGGVLSIGLIILLSSL